MTLRLVAIALAATFLVALAAPDARAEDRASVRAAVDASVQATSPDMLVRYQRPAWQELATQAGCCAPEPAPCDPCCLPYPAPCGSPCEWHGMVSLTGWVPGIDGDMTVRGRSAKIDTTPMDILENLDKIESIFQGRISLYRGKWGFTFGGLTVRFEDTLDLEENGRSITGRVGLDMAEAYVSYCLKRCPMEVGCNPRCPGFRAYEVYAGLRYWSMELGLDGFGAAAPVPAVSRTRSWVDPIIGGRAIYVLGNGWGFDLQGDIGGFGIGSDFSWNLRAGVQYRPWRLMSIDLGIKLTDVDYTKGSGTDRFAFDGLLWGPYFALTFYF